MPGRAVVVVTALAFATSASVAATATDDRTWAIPGTHAICTIDPSRPTLASAIRAQAPELLAGLSADDRTILEHLTYGTTCDSAVRVTAPLGPAASSVNTTLCYYDGVRAECDNDAGSLPSSDDCGPFYATMGPFLPDTFYGCLTGEIHFHTSVDICREEFQSVMQLRMHTYNRGQTGSWTAGRGSFHSQYHPQEVTLYTSTSSTSWPDHDTWTRVAEGVSNDYLNCTPGQLPPVGSLLATLNDQIHTGYLATWSLYPRGSTTLLGRDEFCFAADWDFFARNRTSGACSQP